MLGNSEAKDTLYFLSPPPVQKSVPTPLTLPIADALHCYTHLRQFFTVLCPNAGYPNYATAGCERKDKKIMLLNSVSSPNFFDSFGPLTASLATKHLR